MSEPTGMPQLDVDGAAAPPRENGELVFSTPWESRVFGLAVSLHRSGLFEWEEFRQRLIAQIRRFEQEHPEASSEAAGWSYYRCWLEALTGLLEEKGVCSAAELSRRTQELEARPHGHDHG